MTNDMPVTLQEIKTEELCNSILRINKNIQSVDLINKFGRLVENVARDDSRLKQLPHPKNEMFFMQCVLEISM